MMTTDFVTKPYAVINEILKQVRYGPTKLTTIIIMNFMIQICLDFRLGRMQNVKGVSKGFDIEAFVIHIIKRLLLFE